MLPCEQQLLHVLQESKPQSGVGPWSGVDLGAVMKAELVTQPSSFRGLANSGVFTSLSQQCPVINRH